MVEMKTDAAGVSKTADRSGVVCARCGSAIAEGEAGLGRSLCGSCAPYSESSELERTVALGSAAVAQAGGSKGVGPSAAPPSGAETVLIARSTLTEPPAPRAPAEPKGAESSHTILAKPGADEAPVAATTVRASLSQEVGSEKRALPLAAGATVVGAEGSDVTISDADLAKQHFRVEARGNEFFLHDLPGSSGTYLNGYRIRAVKLMSEDRITAGSATFTFTIT